jgi:hypothetical protein
MRFYATHISTSIAGDYYQALFAVEQDAGDSDSSYLLLQPQFESPMVTNAISRRTTGTTAVISGYAVSNSRRRNCPLSSTVRWTM